MEALSSAGRDPVDRILALVFAAIDPKVLKRQNLTLWNSFWSEASLSEGLSELSDRYDAERQDIQISLL